MVHTYNGYPANLNRGTPTTGGSPSNTGGTASNPGTSGTTGADPKRGNSFVAKDEVSLPPKAQEQADLKKAWKSDGAAMVYSENMGILDRAHITGYAHNHHAAYEAAMKAFETGKPQTITLQLGQGYTSTYTIDPKQSPSGSPRDAALEIANGIAANASVNYEKHTDVMGMNKQIQWVGERVGSDTLQRSGTSAFSTEDLPSNGLGVDASTAWIKSGGTGAPPQSFIDNYVLNAAGNLKSVDDAKLRRSAYGNTTFIPQFEEGAKPGKYPATLDALEAERVRQSKTDPDAASHLDAQGWYRSDTGPSTASFVWDKLGGLLPW